MEKKSSLPPSKKSSFSTLFVGGLLPIIIFTVIEDNYGPVYGTIAAIVFGIGEIIFEKAKYKKVNSITWVANGLVVGLGVISIYSQDGIWFKMQPALLEAMFALFLWGTLIFKKNFLQMMMEKQGQTVPEFMKQSFNGITFRLGIFFVLHAVLATWAALHWTTAQWAWLKGAGVTVSMILYLIAEFLWIRRRLKKRKEPPDLPVAPR